MGPLALALLTGALAAAPAPPPVGVTVAMSSSGQDAAVYRVEVRNGAPDAANLVVRQSIPRGVAVTATTPAATVTATEITWPVPLAAGQSQALTATFGSAPDGRLSTGACAYGSVDGAPAGCAVAAWEGTGAAGPAPWWRHWFVPLALAFVALGVLAVVLRRRAGPAPARAGPAPAGARRVRRRGPPLWTVLVLAVALLIAGGAAVAATAVPRLAAITGTAGPSPPGWVGPAPAGAVGEELRENAFAFTAYRVVCDGNRCAADVGATNPSSAPELWYPAMQRITHPGGFVPVDEPATLSENGRDVFAGPLSPGERRFARLWFVLPPDVPAEILELRSGAFANGVRVDF
jgi:hypothetical protein